MVTWADSFALTQNVHNFSEDRTLTWPLMVMNHLNQGIPITARHMDICESYPSTYDVLHNNLTESE